MQQPQVPDDPAILGVSGFHNLDAVDGGASTRCHVPRASPLNDEVFRM